MKAILVANPKGGAGKTTLSINLAGWLAVQGESVSLLDLDRQKSATRWLARRPENLPPIRLLGEAPIDVLLTDVVMPGMGGRGGPSPSPDYRSEPPPGRVPASNFRN